MSQRNQSKRIQSGWSHSVRARDGYKCQRCQGRENLQAHHIIPLAQGGKNTLKNGITLCKECHEKEHQLSTMKYAAS